MKGIDVMTIDPILKTKLGGNTLKPTEEQVKRFHKIRKFIKKQKSNKNNTK